MAIAVIAMHLHLSQVLMCKFANLQIMNTNDNMLTDISAELENEYGLPGSPERDRFDEAAYAFYTGQLLLDARKEAKVTQSELARRIHSTKSYVSRIENGLVTPSVVTFYRIISALDLRIDIVKSIR